MGLAGDDTLLFKLIFSPESKNFDQYHCNAKKKMKKSLSVQKLKHFAFFVNQYAPPVMSIFFLLKLFRLFKFVPIVNILLLLLVFFNQF
jgi:hypothetical protein